MKHLFPCLLALSLLFSLAVGTVGADESQIQCIMPDGQLRSHPVKVFIPNRVIKKEGMDPKLCLVRLLDKPRTSEEKILDHCETSYEPFKVASNQVWVDQRKEDDTSPIGTLLLFDLSQYPIPTYKTGVRVLPLLQWKDGVELIAISEREVYLSNGIGAILWTVGIILAILIIACILTRKHDEKLLGLVMMKDGMSMSLTQMALWTITVGGVLLGYGIMRLEVPEIPYNLVFLMGTAAGTSATGHWQTFRWRRSKGFPKGSGPTDHQTKAAKKRSKLQTLLMVEVDGELAPSLAKTQILFWTLISLILFVVKSTLDGQLWDVPTQLVFLMGVSQSSFLLRNELAVRDAAKDAEKGTTHAEAGSISETF